MQDVFGRLEGGIEKNDPRLDLRCTLNLGLELRLMPKPRPPDAGKNNAPNASGRGSDGGQPGCSGLKRFWRLRQLQASPELSLLA